MPVVAERRTADQLVAGSGMGRRRTTSPSRTSTVSGAASSGCPVQTSTWSPASPRLRARCRVSSSTPPSEGGYELGSRAIRVMVVGLESGPSSHGRACRRAGRKHMRNAVEWAWQWDQGLGQWLRSGLRGWSGSARAAMAASVAPGGGPAGSGSSCPPRATSSWRRRRRTTPRGSSVPRSRSRAPSWPGSSSGCFSIWASRRRRRVDAGSIDLVADLEGGDGGQALDRLTGIDVEHETVHPPGPR